MTKKPSTLRSRVRAALRMVWMRSPERAAALKRDGYTCTICGKKQSRASGRECKVQVHHLDGIMDWNEVLDFVLASGLFCNREYLTTYCKTCHGGLKNKHNSLDKIVLGELK
jgi:hypothetical protein